MTLKEFFLLADARADASQIPEDARKELSEHLDRGGQRASAAEALWANGHSAEGFRMIVGAFETTMRAVPAFASAIGAELTGRDEDDLSPLLGARLPPDRVARLLEVRRSIADATLPALDEEMGAGDADLYAEIVECRRDVGLALAPAATTPATLASARNWRIAFAALVALAAVVGAFLVLYTPGSIEADASALWSPDFPAANLIDGDPASEWQLPDNEGGWIEVVINPPTRVGTLRLLNGHNRHYNDRATRRYRVDLFSGGSLARTIEAEWDALVPEPAWVEHPVGVDAIERIRIEVLSHHGLGAGLAEMEWR